MGMVASTAITEAIIWGSATETLLQDADMAVRVVRGSLGTLWEVEISRLSDSCWQVATVLAPLIGSGQLAWVPPEGEPSDTLIIHFWEARPRTDQGRRAHSNTPINSPSLRQPG